MESAKRPQRNKSLIGVKIIAAIWMINAIICLGVATMRIFLSDQFNSSEPGWMIWSLMLGLSGLFVWMAKDLWQLKRWAWIASIVICSLLLLTFTANLIQNHIWSNLKDGWYLYLLLPALVYLFLPSVRRAFAKRSE